MEVRVLHCGDGGDDNSGPLTIIFVSLSLADFLQSLAKTLLSLETPTRGKYILLTSLTQHVPVGTILETSPDLPQELLRAMGHQVLACHVSWIIYVCT